MCHPEFTLKVSKLQPVYRAAYTDYMVVENLLKV